LILGIELAFICASPARTALAAQAVPDVCVRVLVKEAGSPEVFYADPARCDSLVDLLASRCRERPDELLELLDTPWATHFEVLRRALEKAGAPAREAVIRKIGEAPPKAELSLLLAVFEKLGVRGDERYLEGAFRSGEPSVLVCAARCLASFGEGPGPVERLKPLFSQSPAQVRLAAAWAAARVYERDPQERIARTLTEAIRPLLDDPIPLVRFTAAETLRIVSGPEKGIPEPLYPGH